MPLARSRFVVIGLTNGPAMTTNPCLREQIEWAKSADQLISVYAVATYPSDEQLRTYGSAGPFNANSPSGRLSNWGYAQAQHNLRTLRASGLRVPGIWIDVEPVPSPPLVAWSGDTAANANVVRGIHHAYTKTPLNIGAYSTRALWAEVAGDYQLGVPEWRAAGEAGMDEAIRRCDPEESFQGGGSLIGQWLEDNRDHNITCPGEGARIGEFFARQ